MSNELNDDQDNPSLEVFKDDIDEVTSLEDFLPIDEMVEEVSEGGKKVRRKGIYLLPNLFTSAALFAGFFAIIAAINGDFSAAMVEVNTIEGNYYIVKEACLLYTSPSPRDS